MKISELPIVCGLEDGSPRVAPSTMRLYRYAVARLVGWGGDRTLDEVQAADALAFHQHLRDVAQLRTSSANAVRRTLRGMFRRVGRDDLARPLRQLRSAPAGGKAMSEEHLRLMMAHASVRDLAMISLLAMSGGRRGVVSTLRKEHVRIWEGEGGDWRLAVRAITKNEQEVLLLGGHVAAVAMSLWLEVQPLAEETAYVFTTDLGTPLKPNTVNDVFERVACAAHLPAGSKINPHALRHKFALEKLSQHDAAMVAAWMGHSSPRVTLEVYGRPDEERLIDAFFGGR